MLLFGEYQNLGVKQPIFVVDSLTLVTVYLGDYLEQLESHTSFDVLNTLANAMLAPLGD